MVNEDEAELAIWEWQTYRVNNFERHAKYLMLSRRSWVLSMSSRLS